MTQTEIACTWESKCLPGNKVMIDENTFWFIPNLSAIGVLWLMKPKSYLARNIPGAGDRAGGEERERERKKNQTCSPGTYMVVGEDRKGNRWWRLQLWEVFGEGCGGCRSENASRRWLLSWDLKVGAADSHAKSWSFPGERGRDFGTLEGQKEEWV